jgi:hypothetical protein
MLSLELEAAKSYLGPGNKDQIVDVTFAYHSPCYVYLFYELNSVDPKTFHTTALDPTRHVAWHGW